VAALPGKSALVKTEHPAARHGWGRQAASSGAIDLVLTGGASHGCKGVEMSDLLVCVVRWLAASGEPALVRVLRRMCEAYPK
jgi:hypothetical protein